VSYKLPDNQIIKLESEIHECSEVLFEARDNFKGLHQEIKNVIMSCDKMIIEELFKNILLVGGTSKLEGLKERLEKELKAIVENFEVEIKSSPEADLNVWHGGKIFAHQRNFHENFLHLE
jgi:actin-related protein